MKKYPIVTERGSYRVSIREVFTFSGPQFEIKVYEKRDNPKWYQREYGNPETYRSNIDRHRRLSVNLVALLRECVEHYEERAEGKDELESWDGDM